MVDSVERLERKTVYSELIASDAYEVCKEVRTILDRLQTAYHINSDQSFDIRVILSELLQNAMKHGNSQDTDKKILVDIWLQDNMRELAISVADQGLGFDVGETLCRKQMAMKKCDPLEMDESGRGLCIVKDLCQGMEFNSRGNAITVTKRLDTL